MVKRPRTFADFQAEKGSEGISDSGGKAGDTDSESSRFTTKKRKFLNRFANKLPLVVFRPYIYHYRYFALSNAITPMFTFTSTARLRFFVVKRLNSLSPALPPLSLVPSLPFSA